MVIGNITGCIGYWFKITYNSTLLSLDSWTFDTDPANPTSPTQMASAPSDRVETDSSVAGTVQRACLWKLGVGVPSGNYTFDSVAARGTFQVIFIPSPLLEENNTVSTQFALDKTELSRYHRSDTEIFFLTYSYGYFEYTTRERVVGDVDGDLDVDVGNQRIQQLHIFESW